MNELRYWYQWYFQTERGRAGLRANRRDIAFLLWRLWSPNWKFDNATLAQTAASFDNPDFVEVTIHSYRHRFANAPGDPAYQTSKSASPRNPRSASPPSCCKAPTTASRHPRGRSTPPYRFTAHYEHRLIPVAGHFLARETPEHLPQAVRDLLA